MFKCKRCGKQWQEKGYCEEGVFYTLCESCAADVIFEWTMGITKVELQEVKQKR